MAGRYEIELVDADDPEALRRGIDAVSEDGRPRYLRRSGEVIVAIRLSADAGSLADNTSQPVERPFTLDDPLWKAVGIFSGDATDVSERHDDYIADALA